jgi:hypothetical protein
MSHHEIPTKNIYQNLISESLEQMKDLTLSLVYGRTRPQPIGQTETNWTVSGTQNVLDDLGPLHPGIEARLEQEHLETYQAHLENEQQAYRERMDRLISQAEEVGIDLESSGNI